MPLIVAFVVFFFSPVFLYCGGADGYNLLALTWTLFTYFFLSASDGDYCFLYYSHEQKASD